MDDIQSALLCLSRAVEVDMLCGLKEIPFTGNREDMTMDIKALETSISQCQACDLGQYRKNLVFGEGDAHAELMFVGEAPGAEEDEQGRPFVGRAGKLLTKAIEALGLERRNVYIANIIKCRPPGNRNPQPDEIIACLPALREQIKIIGPRVICTLGKFASQTLLSTDMPISRIRGKFFEMGGVKVMPMYHPAYLLRNPGAKKDFWEDLKSVASSLGMTVPDHRSNKN